MLTSTDRDCFVKQGHVRIEGAFSPDLAAAARAILYDAIGCDPGDPATWPGLVVRVGDRADPLLPFEQAIIAALA